MTLVSTICRMPAMKPVGERSAGNPHAAFDERGRETEQCYRARPRTLPSAQERLCADVVMWVDAPGFSVVWAQWRRR